MSYQESYLAFQRLLNERSENLYVYLVVANPRIEVYATKPLAIAARVRWYAEALKENEARGLTDEPALPKIYKLRVHTGEKE